MRQISKQLILSLKSLNSLKRFCFITQKNQKLRIQAHPSQLDSVKSSPIDMKKQWYEAS